MRRKDDSIDGWEVTYDFDKAMAGKMVQFKFVVDDKDWRINKDLMSDDDGSGNINNYIIVSENKQIKYSEE